MSNEIDTLKKLKSEYIVCIHDVVQTANKLYIVTEKGGPDLFEFFDEHPDGGGFVYSLDSDVFFCFVLFCFILLCFIFLF